MAWRCDVARCASGWPVAAAFWGVVPPDRAAEISGQVSRLRETRFCASLSGPYNLMLTVWLRSLADLQPFEVLLAKQVPDFAITARNLILWQLKLGSHILDPYGRCIRGAPMALWPEHDAVAAEHTLLNSMRFGDAGRAPHAGAGTGSADPAAFTVTTSSSP